jgi:hypothetical protein
MVLLFPVTVYDGIDVHVIASYFQGQGIGQCSLFGNLVFNPTIAELISKTFRDPPVSKTLRYSVIR